MIQHRKAGKIVPVYVIRLEFEGGHVRYPTSDCSLGREQWHAHRFTSRPLAERELNGYLTEHHTMYSEFGLSLRWGQVIRVN